MSTSTLTPTPSSTAADKLAILELLNRYILSIDTHDDAAFADNFHDDGVYVSPFGTATGRAAIVATIHQWHAGGITAGKRHMMGTFRIDLDGLDGRDGDRATSQSSYFIVDAADAPRVVASGGYADVITREGGAWKLKERVQTIDPSFKMGGQQ